MMDTGSLNVKGTLTLAADPALAKQASTKSYVDNAVATQTYTASANGGLTLTGKAFSANTTGVTTGLVSGNIAVRSTGTIDQVLKSSGTAGGEAAWGALNLASANAVTGTLSVGNGGTGVTTLTALKTALGASSVYRTSFTNANLATGVLTVNHALGQQFVQVTVTDNTNAVVQPDGVVMANSTQTTVDLSSFGTLTGTWNVVVTG